MGLGMIAADRVGGLACADEGENVDAAGGDQRRHDRFPLAVDRVDDAGRKSLGEGGEKRLEEEDAVLRRFDDHRISHDERGDERREGLVEGIVEGAHAERDPQGGAAHLGHDPLHLLKTRPGPIELLDRRERVADVGDGAVKLLLAVGAALADLPDKRLDDALADGDHQAEKSLHAADPRRHRHRRPDPTSLPPGGRSGSNRLVSLGLTEEREGAERRRRPSGEHRREDVAHRPVPATKLPADEPLPLVDGSGGDREGPIGQLDAPDFESACIVTPTVTATDRSPGELAESPTPLLGPDDVGRVPLNHGNHDTRTASRANLD